MSLSLLFLRESRRSAGPCLRALSTTSYTDVQKAKGRPVSPHVTRYAFPIVALTSITQRVTGVMLTVGLGGLAGISLAGGDVGGIASAIGASSFAPVAKFCVAFPLTYHFLGAARHAYWDAMPEALENDQVVQASWVIVAGSLVSSVGLAAMSFPAKSEPKIDA